MNPQFEQSPGLHLPQPSLEPASVQGASEGARQPERMEGGREQTSTSVASVPPQPIMSPPQSLAVPLPVQTSTTTVASSTDADDGGLDEEWITKAKQIVERTQADPYLQSSELGKFKAVYLKSRHNKEVKVAEDSAR